MQGEEGSGASTPLDGTATPDLDFSDLKKKKKKKAIPLDIGEDSGASTPVAKEGEGGAAEAAPGDDLDFSDLKKKKKKNKNKAVLDLEAFERELGEAGGEGNDGAYLEHIDEHELGEDVFASGGGAGEAHAGAEPWLGSDRDYTYDEVLSYKLPSSFGRCADDVCSSFTASTISSMHKTRRCYHRLGNVTLLLRRPFIVKETKSRFSQTSPISASGCIGLQNMSFNSCSQKWERPDLWMALDGWLLKVVSNRSRWRTS